MNTFCLGYTIHARLLVSVSILHLIEGSNSDNSHRSKTNHESFIMPGSLSNPKEYQDIFHWAETQKDGSVPSFATRKNDPYEVRPCQNLLHQPKLMGFSTNLDSTMSMTQVYEPGNPQVLKCLVLRPKLYQEPCHRDRTVPEMFVSDFMQSR